MTHYRSHQPSYNAKVPCECGRGMKSKTSPACRQCGQDKMRATKAAQRARTHQDEEARELTYDTALSAQYLRRSLRANA